MNKTKKILATALVAVVLCSVSFMHRLPCEKKIQRGNKNCVPRDVKQWQFRSNIARVDISA